MFDVNDMKIPTDDGYISKYLIHWTGKNSDKEGAKILSIIASSCQLLLSYNQIHVFDWSHEIHENMVCFTDVPLLHTANHCKKYGHFGIAFHKLRLMNVGAQPVFYSTHANKRDFDRIFKFLQQQSQNLTIDKDLFKSLHRHFYYTQRFSNGKADKPDSFYYEREWRLGEQSLLPPEKFNRPNAKYHSMREGYSPYTGKMVKEGNRSYFKFEKKDVAFLIVLPKCEERIDNPHKFSVFTYDDLVSFQVK